MSLLIATEHSAASSHLRSTVVLMKTVAAFTGDGAVSIAVANGLAEASGVDLRFAAASPCRRSDRVDPLEWSEVGITAVVGMGSIASRTAGTLTCVGTTIAAHFTSIELASTTTSTSRGNQFHVRGRRRWRRRRGCTRWWRTRGRISWSGRFCGSRRRSGTSITHSRCRDGAIDLVGPRPVSVVSGHPKEGSSVA